MELSGTGRQEQPRQAVAQMDDEPGVADDELIVTPLEPG
jgi:hypothetical protein